jgi:hypothetical protein
VKKFILQITLFFLFFLFTLFFGLLLPSTPKASTSLLFAKIAKDSLLENTKTPRIIFVGGSNLSFGINSQMIQDSLHINPINTSIHAVLGLIYMMESTIKYIRNDDIVIVSAEYEQFFGGFAYGGEELLRTVVEISPSEILDLQKDQWLNILKFLPKYSLSKFKLNEYFFDKKKHERDNKVYLVNSYNKYGDVSAHWKLEQVSFPTTEKLVGDYNPTVLNKLKEFKYKLQKKGANLYVTFPSFQSKSFENIKENINKVEYELKKNNFILLGNPLRYKTPDSLMFNSTYHLTKMGVDVRTQLLIKDFKNVNHQLH